MAYSNTTNNLEGSFVSPNTHKPIVGTYARNFNVDGLSQARVTTNDLISGSLVKITTSNVGSANAGSALNPNAFEIASLATSVADADGIVLVSPNDIVGLKDVAGQPKAGQIALVGLLGSGLKVWLKIDSASALTAKVSLKAKWSYTQKGGVKLDNAGTLDLKLSSSVVDGVELYLDNDGSVKSRDAKVALFKI